MDRVSSQGFADAIAKGRIGQIGSETRKENLVKLVLNSYAKLTRRLTMRQLVELNQIWTRFTVGVTKGWARLKVMGAAHRSGCYADKCWHVVW